MTQVAFKPVMANAPQFGFRGEQADQDGPGFDAPNDRYEPDLRSQRLTSGAKKFGLSVLLSLASAAAFSFAPKQMTQLALTKGGMIGLTIYGLVNSAIGLWGLVDLGRGLFTKSGQYANQPSPQPAAE